MALPPQFLDELRARTPLSAVIGRRVRLARSGRQWKGCCPFHGEKTPSFYVYDDHFHCFGCGVHGDAIGFVMQSVGLSFPEAVEQLAAEAGMTVPKPSAEAAVAERRRLDLSGVLEAAAMAYQRRLGLPEGKAARDYLEQRGLSAETIDKHGLGWSGESRGAVAADLTQQGVSTDDLIGAGLMRRDEDSGRVYDLFFNRVMFPIRDRRGRTISFGGRIMGDGQPKYLNGPETELFSKRRTLYGLNLAREAVRRGAAVVVVEGYMDVIALSQAGFDAAVAPLGTALTEEQLTELWNLSPSPVLCFDGDAAGGRAAARSAELALPLLTPERSLRLIALPAGEDPDSLVTRQGARAFQTMLDGARPLAECLYDLFRETTGEATPEQRALLRNRLEDAAKRIQHPALSAEYRRLLLDRFFASRARAKPNGAPRSPGRAALASRGHAAARPEVDTAAVAAERARILTAILLRHPNILRDVGHAYTALELDPPLGQLRNAISEWVSDAEVLDSQALMHHLDGFGLRGQVDHVLAGASLALPACASISATHAEAVEGWWHIFGFLNVDLLAREVDLARQEASKDMNGETQRRLVALTGAFIKVRTGEPDGTDAAA